VESKLRVLITGGPTREYIDDVRFISNASTGLISYLLCKKLCESNKAKVFLVSGPTSQPFKSLALSNYSLVETTQQMLRMVIKFCKKYSPQFAIFSAAVADYTPVRKKYGKISSQKNHLFVKLKPTKKIIDEVESNFPNIKKIGFKLEFSKKRIKNIDKYVKDYMRKKKLEALCLNFLTDIKTNSYKAYFYINGKKPKIVYSKEKLAKYISDYITSY